MARAMVNLGPSIGPIDVNRVGVMLDSLNAGDELMINLESDNFHDADAVYRLLDSRGLNYQSSSCPNGGCHISVTSLG